MQERAANIGYDWPDVEGVLDKVVEETARARRVRDRHAERTEEFGDLLMVLVNVGRKLGIEAEAALRAGERQVPPPLRDRRAPRRGAGRRAP